MWWDIDGSLIQSNGDLVPPQSLINSLSTVLAGLKVATTNTTLVFAAQSGAAVYLPAYRAASISLQGQTTQGIPYFEAILLCGSTPGRPCINAKIGMLEEGFDPISAILIYFGNPCANSTLSATGVNVAQQIATAQGYIAAGEIGAGGAPSPYPIFSPVVSYFGGMYGYYGAVKTGGPNDIKDLPGHSRRNPIDVDAGNISFGITCPYGAAFCQFAAGVAQTMAGDPDFRGTLITGFDTPSDNAAIQIGQAMRAAGCHE